MAYYYSFCELLGAVCHGLYLEEDLYTVVGDSHFIPFYGDSPRVSSIVDQ